MTDLKLSTWIIVLAVFSTGIIVASSWILAIDDQYPAANVSADWSNSFNKMSNINATTLSVRETIESGEEPKATDLGEILLTGIPSAISRGLKSLGLIDDMVSDFNEQSNIPIPKWTTDLIVIIIVIALIFTIISAWLKRSL